MKETEFQKGIKSWQCSEMRKHLLIADPSNLPQESLPREHTPDKEPDQEEPQPRRGHRRPRRASGLAGAPVPEGPSHEGLRLLHQWRLRCIVTGRQRRDERQQERPLDQDWCRLWVALHTLVSLSIFNGSIFAIMHSVLTATSFHTIFGESSKSYPPLVSELLCADAHTAYIVLFHWNPVSLIWCRLGAGIIMGEKKRSYLFH